jgi:DNA-binding NarL/FixJ family response regulator
LDGLPLAIELAAARIKTLPPRVILERLEHRLHLLVGGAHDLPARQQTLRDAVDWSFSLLSPDEQVLLARMAIFVGGCSLPAIENVCDYDGSLGSDILALVTSLADKSLVMPAEAGGDVRFRMLETIREFGLENLHLRGEVEELRRQHARYFTQLVEQCMPHISDPDQAVWLDMLTQENGNLRAVLSWSLSPDNGANRVARSDGQRTGHSSPRFEIGLNMATQLARFWHRQGYINEGRAWLEASIRIAAPDPDTESAANPYARQLMKAISGAGTLAQASGDYTAARRSLNRSLALARGLGDEEAIGNELNGLGELNNDTGDYAQAQHYLEQSLEISRRLNQEDRIALRLTGLAFAVMGQEKYAEARDLEEESLAIRRKLGDAEGVGRSLYNLASLERRTGNRSQARIYAQEVLGIARRLGFKQGIAHALSIIGEADYFKKDYPGALVSLHESLVLFSETSRRLGEIDTLSVIARVLADSGRWRKAALLLSALATVRKQMNIVKSEYDAEEAEVIERCLQAMQSTRERERWQSAWEQGSRMTWEEAVALAIAIPVPGQATVEIQPNSQPEQVASVNMAEIEGLTERELQIVRLIAQSKSNQEIGQLLVVTKRTVETHISNILSKLGFTSRGQIAAWAIRRGLI